MSSLIRVEHEFVLPGVTPDQAWIWLADTNRLNQLGGLPPVDTVVEGAPGGATRSRVKTRGFFPPMAWREGPFEFVRPRYHVVERTFTRGPLRFFRGGMRQQQTDGDTRATLFAEFDLRWRVLASIVRWDAQRRMRKMAERVQTAVARWHETGAPVYAPPATPLAPGGQGRLRTGLEIVREKAPVVAGRLGALLESGPDLEVLRLRPFELADQWKLPRLDVLRALLYAARAGLVDLHWDINCPHCRLPAYHEDTLAALEPEAHCDVCDYSFAATFHETVEVTFAIAPALRSIKPVAFCLGAPARRDGVFLQAVLAPREKRDFTIHLPAGDYDVDRADASKAAHLHVGEGPREAELRITRAGVEPDEIALGAGEVTLTKRNDGDVSTRVQIGRRGPRDDFASAALVTRLQDFRDLFSAQVLAPGVRMGIASIAILFTDLHASTALYERLGDAPAYANVRDHFAVLADAVRAHAGGIVKTIGDAVMAAFATPEDAVQAALAMRQALDELNARPNAPKLVMKIGLHAGACIAVNANDRLDYFGRTVNLAARLAPLSNGKDIVISASAAREISNPALDHEPFERELKGLETQSLVRLAPKN